MSNIQLDVLIASSSLIGSIVVYLLKDWIDDNIKSTKEIFKKLFK